MLRIVSVLYGVLVIPSLVLPLSSIYLFDAPGSEDSPLTSLFALSISIAPFVLLTSCVGGLKSTFGDQTETKTRAGYIWGWLPVINLGFIIIVFLLLETFCGGRLACSIEDMKNTLEYPPVVNLTRTKIIGKNSSVASDMGLLQAYLDDYYEQHGVYPLGREDIDVDWKLTNWNPNRISWDWGIEYFSIEDGQSYVIRGQLETDYSGILRKENDRDGLYGSVNCDDQLGYLCYGPE